MTGARCDGVSEKEGEVGAREGIDRGTVIPCGGSVQKLPGGEDHGDGFARID